MTYLESVKKLTKEINKLEQIIFTSKDNISSLESKNKSLEKKLELLKEKQKDSILNPSTSNEDDEPDKCDNCDISKLKVVIFKEHLSSLPKEDII